MIKNAYVFPGQGAQKPWMGKSFYDDFASARSLFERAEDELKMSIRKHIFTSDEAYLQRTDFCQVALFVTSCATLRVIEEQTQIQPYVCAGLSLGEYTALCAAKKASFRDCLHLVSQRGIFMQEAIKSPKQAMSAVVGLDPDVIKQHIQVANINCPGQVIISGSEKEITQAEKTLRNIGARRTLRLNVAGAFHSSYMNDARESLCPYIEKLALKDSSILFVMNVSGKASKSNKEIKTNLINQISSTTNWVACVKEMEVMNVNYIEIGPRQLQAINRKNKIKNQILTIEESKDMELLYEQIYK